MFHRKLASHAFVAVILSFSILASGCKVPKLISGVGFQVEPNIETAKVQLNFDNSVQSDLGGSYAIKDYGSVEIEPWTPSTPFNVGFRLNLEIVNDQDYVRLNPVTTLPSGEPLPKAIGGALAQIKLKNEINKNFDVYAYVDVVGKQWVGVVVTLNVVNNKYFPAGLSISQNFLQDAQGFARAAAAVFGPKLDDQGTVAVPGGIAIFANIASLIKGNKAEGFDPGKQVYFFDGKLAPHYRAHPRDAATVTEAFRVLLNSDRPI